jgi:uncharacterized protein YggU (UPF0235/DUF167 family)
VADDLLHVDDDDRLSVLVRAQLGAGRAEVVGHRGRALIVRVAVPPKSPRADTAVVRLLADAFGVAEAAIEPVDGTTAAGKAFRITGVDEPTARLVIDRLLADSGERNPARRHR